MAMVARSTATHPESAEVILTTPRGRRHPFPRRRLSPWQWRGTLLALLTVGCLTLHALTVWEGQQIARYKQQQNALTTRMHALRAQIEERLSALTPPSTPATQPPVPLTVQRSATPTSMLGRR